MKVMQGTIRSTKSMQTVIVTVTNRWQHPLYKKFVKRTKNYACHVAEGMKFATGDVVMIEECRPISKTKKFKVTSKVENAKLEVVKEEVKETVKKEKKEKKAK